MRRYIPEIRSERPRINRAGTRVFVRTVLESREKSTEWFQASLVFSVPNRSSLLCAQANPPLGLQAVDDPGRDRLKRRAARYAAIWNATVDAVITIDSRGIINGFNPAAERLFLYSRSEAVGENVSILMPEPDRSAHNGYLASYLSTQEPHIIGVGREVLARRKDGSTFMIHLSVGEFEHDGARGFIGILRDLSAQKRTERRLNRSDQMLNRIFEDAPLASATFDLSGRILRVNRQFEAVLGFSRQDAGELDLRQLFQTSEPSVDLTDILAGRASSAPQGSLVQLTARSGDEHLVQIHFGLIYSEDGRPVMGVVQFEDQTERRRAQADARRHREHLSHVSRVSVAGEMASGLAHEVNQPLSAIANYSRALIRLLPPDKEPGASARSIAEKIDSQAQRAGEIVRRFRGFVKANHPERSALDVNRVVDEVVAFARLDSRGEVEIETSLTPGLPAVKAGRVELQQVILNLLLNAVESTRSAGGENRTVCVRTSHADAGGVAVLVEDRGIGIPEEIEEEILRPFFSNKDGGMGLGLPISRSIVESLGGRLSFERNSDRGVTFAVVLPEHENE